MKGLITIVFEYEDRGQAVTFDQGVFETVNAATCVKVLDYQSSISETVDGRTVVGRNLRRFGSWAAKQLG